MDCGYKAIVSCFYLLKYDIINSLVSAQSLIKRTKTSARIR